MRYFDFIKEIKEISTSHILVNEYGEGDIYEYLNNGEHKYPCIFLTVTNLNTTDSGTAINFTLFYTDRLVENQANKTSIQSTGISVIKQILSKYEQLHPEYLLNSVNYTPFTEKFTDMCAGVFCDVVIENQIDTLEDYDNECEEGAFTVKTITLTKNGIYDIVGYDSAVVLVETPMETITITENGVYVPEEGGYNEVIVDIEIPECPDCPETPLESITITENGVYVPEEGGYNEVIVDVYCDEVQLGQLVVSENGNYYPIDYEVNGFDLVTVEVPETPLTDITITENGVYVPEEGGYNEVVVDVAGGNVKKLKVSNIQIDNSCLDNNTWYGYDDLYNNIDRTYLNSFELMFHYSSDLLRYLDVSNWDVSNILNMRYMFLGCSNIHTLDVSNWDVSNVTNMHGMFQQCELLEELDVSNWDVSNVTNMGYMFFDCKTLQTLDVSKTLDVSNWDVSNVTHMGYMFYGCKSIGRLDLTDWFSWNLENISYFAYDSSIGDYVGGRTIDEVVTKHIKIFDGLRTNAYYVLSDNANRASLRALINGLVRLSYTTAILQLTDTQKSKLTDEDIIYATNKGWTIA